MIKFFKFTFFIPLFISLNINAQNFQRVISWDYLQNGERKQTSQISGYLFFPNAVYDDNETMVPSYYELFPIPLYIQNINELEILIENTKYSVLSETEKKKIKSLKNIELLKPYYSLQQSRKNNFLAATIPAIRVNQAGEIERLNSFTLNIKVNSLQKQQKSTYYTFKTSSVLNSGKWVKVKVNETGIYKITYSELQSYGFTNMANVSVWGNGGLKLPYINSTSSPDDIDQIPIYIEKGNDNIFNEGDYILFFAQGPVTWKYETANDFFMHEVHPYSKEISYFITTDYSSPKRITDIQSTTLPSTYQTSTFDALVAFEKNDTNLIKSGRDWYGESFDVYTNQSFDTKLSNPVVGSNVKLRVRTSARSSSSSSYSVYVNDVYIGSNNHTGVIIGDEESDYFSVKQQNYTTTAPSGDLVISLAYNKPSSAALGWLDYICVNSRQQLSYPNKQYLFRDSKSVGTGVVSQFTIQNATAGLQLWDITNIHYPRRIINAISGNTASFTLPTDTLRQFIAFENNKAYSVTYAGEVSNQNLHGLPQTDMFIVSPPSMFSYAEELADIHKTNDGLSVNLVTTDQIYNEFSSGNRDVSAIRNFMRMFYKRATNEDDMPKYLLLFGDGSYDNMSDTKGNTNLIPTYQSAESTNKSSSFVSDDFFGLLDDSEGEADGLLDIGIGRLPVSTTDQANSVMNKIKQYYNQSSLNDWNSELCFIADDEDGNVHLSDANTIAEYVKNNHPTYNIQKIFFDAYLQESTPTGNRYPDVTNAINNSVNSGALIVNYTGHGNEQWLAHEKVLMLDDVKSWRNFQKLPLFVTATCEFSRFDDYSLTSTGEWILLTPNGGGIGLLSTTRLVYSSPNFTLNYNFFQTVFDEVSIDKHYRLGDIVRITKNISGSGYNKRNFMLLGDPALMLKYPSKSLTLTQINNTPIASFSDTLKSLSKVNISGKVLNSDGSDATSFTGNVSLTLFDKERTVKTLGNDGGITTDFTVRDNIIYKGKATITNGVFSLNCFIPKDINFNVGTGRISMFAINTDETAAGFYQNFLIGGINSNPEIDNQGPTVNIYLNDLKFVSGGITDPNPTLIVKLADSSGINTTGTGIGHDLIATITGKNEKSVVLNNYYNSDNNSFQSGKAELQLSDLSEGSNKIKVKAWDAYNNSSENEISFTVTSDTKLRITHLLNYPNPFTEQTAFYFEHNQPYTDLDILIQIYSPSGKLVKTIRHQEQATIGYHVGPIPWDGRDDFGSRLGRGVYFYRLRVRSSNGHSADQQQKLVLLK